MTKTIERFNHNNYNLVDAMTKYRGAEFAENVIKKRIEMKQFEISRIETGWQVAFWADQYTQIIFPPLKSQKLAVVDASIDLLAYGKYGKYARVEDVSVEYFFGQGCKSCINEELIDRISHSKMQIIHDEVVGDDCWWITTGFRVCGFYSTEDQAQRALNKLKQEIDSKKNA